MLVVAATKVKISGGEKKSEQEHTSFWKFLVVVVQNNSKEMYNKKCATRACKVFVFLLIRPTYIFWLFSLPLPFSITRFYILF